MWDVHRHRSPGNASKHGFWSSADGEHVCASRQGVSQEDAAALLSTWNEEGSKYDLNVKAASYQELPRTGFFHYQIMDQLSEVPLPPSCDRMIYFVNQDAGDFLYGLASISLGLPEVLGEVDDVTLTRG